MDRRSWTLSGLLAGPLRGVAPGERGLPDPSAIAVPARAAGLPRDNDLTGAQRRLATAPLLGARTGDLRWNGVHVRQSSEVTCGALCLLLLAAAGDPVLAAWLTSGHRIVSTPPPELARLSRAELEADGVAERVAAAERAVHTRARVAGGLGGPAGSAGSALPWPRALGTPPWGAARVARFRDVTYTHAVAHDHDVAATRTLLAAVKEATRQGIPVPLYTGGDLGGSLVRSPVRTVSAAVPRHVVLALPWRTPRPELRIYEPGAGRTYGVHPDRLLARVAPSAALGGWSHVVWAVLPASAYPR